MALSSQDLPAVITDVVGIKKILISSFRSIKQFQKYDEGRTERTLKYLEEWCKFIGFEDASDVFSGEEVTDVSNTDQVMHNVTTHTSPSVLTTLQEVLSNATTSEIDATRHFSNRNSFNFEGQDILDPRSLFNFGGDGFWSSTD